MLKNIFPKRSKVFFDTFNEIVVVIAEAAIELENLHKNMSQSKEYAEKIKDLEIKADRKASSIYELLHKTFITPFDRDDIDALISNLDSIIDNIEETSARIYLYEIKEATPEMKDLARLCYNATILIKTAVFSLGNLKNSEHILQSCIEISKLEGEADKISRTALANLFHNETNVVLLIKLKEIYDYLEKTMDCCKDVANIVRNILLEYA